MKKQTINLKDIICITAADIDIFLLKESDKKTDKTNLFTVDEIRLQLEKSVEKALYVLEQQGYNIKKPIKAEVILGIDNEAILKVCNDIQNEKY